MPRLKVQKIDADEAYEDCVRIHGDHRGGITQGSLIWLSTATKRKLVIVYGRKTALPAVSMDKVTRDFFDIDVGDAVSFSIRKAGWWSSLLWASRHSNQSTKIAAQLGVISLFLGAVSLLLGLVPLFQACK